MYVEGYATWGPLTTQHAWCYDRETGLIVDIGWKDCLGYVGVPIREKYATQVMLDRNVHGRVVEDWDANCPIITGVVPREVWEEQL